ncbi:MAG TPA: response regulator [Gemmatimonadaceae bacterium]
MTSQMPEQEQPRPLVIVGSGGEWTGRSLEAVLELNGYTVARCHGGRRTLELARREQPAAVILDESLGELGGVEVTRALRDDPLFDHATPIVLIARAPAAAAIRAEALRAGAWDYYSPPVDIEPLLLKLRTYVRAKQEGEEKRAQQFQEHATGLYTREALQQWARQLGGRARREHEPFACVALTSGAAAGRPQTGDEVSEAMAELANLWRSNSRRSDVMGHLAPNRLAILAPATDAGGASRLVERLNSVVVRAREPGGPEKTVLRAGYSAVEDFAAAEIDPAELLKRAEAALDHAEATNYEKPALSFDQVPHHHA